MNTFKKAAWFGSLLLLLVSQPLPAQTSILPNTPVGKIARLFFEAFNADDDEPMERFTVAYRTANALQRIPVDSRMAQHRQIKGMMVSLVPRKVLKNESQHLVVLAYSETMDTWFETSFDINQANPPKLEKFGLKPGAPPEADSNPAFGEWADLKGLLTSVVSRNDLPGIAMAVIENGEVSEVAVAGVRSIESQPPIERDDRFHLGSITKSMTATLIGWLVEKGQLRSETTLKQLFPDIDMLAYYEGVTIRQLLDHTAGIPSYLTVREEKEQELLSLPGNPTQQRLAFAELLLTEKPANEQGQFAYSNAGYTLLATIAESLTGHTYMQLLDQVIFKPLAMETAGLGWPHSTTRLNQPVGHFNEKGALRAQRSGEYELGPYIQPAGDLHASIQDLAHYVLAHLNGLKGQNGLLAASSVQWLHGTQTDQSYAGGWFISQTKEGTHVHEHAGSAGTFMALMLIEPENNRAWVIAANAGGLALDGLFRKLIDAYRHK